MSTLTGARAVVTGAGGGLGRALALELAARGAQVACADVSMAGAHTTVGEIRRLHPEVQTFAAECDVTSVEAVEALAQRTEATFGGVDLVANNAGVAVSGAIGEASLEDWKHVVDVNLWGVIHGCHVFVPRFRKQRKGYVLNVASAAGLLAPPNLGPYNVTKAAVVALSETLHGEAIAYGVHVTVVCPTFFKTGILDASRGPSDEDQKDAVRKMMERSKVQAPDVARAAIDGVIANRLYVVPMLDGRTLWAFKRVAPGLFHRMAARAAARMGIATK